MLSTTPLREIIGTEREQIVIETINEFSCKDKDVEFFLKKKAFDFEKRDKSRTYLVYENEAFLDGDVSILAYFTVSLKSLEFHDTVSKNKIKDIDGFSKEVKGVAIALIGQFGKDENRAQNVPGKDLIELCMQKLYQVHALIGGRYVLIECQDHEKIVCFYQNNNFEFLQADKSDNYLQMVRKM